MPVKLNSHYSALTDEELEAKVAASGMIDGEFHHMAAIAPNSGGYTSYPALIFAPDDTPIAWAEVWTGDTMAAKITWGTGDVEGIELDDFSENAPEVLEAELDEYHTTMYEVPCYFQGNMLLGKLKDEGMSLEQARDWLLDRWPHSEIKHGTVFDYNETINDLYTAGEARWPERD